MCKQKLNNYKSKTLINVQCIFVKPHLEFWLANSTLVGSLEYTINIICFLFEHLSQFKYKIQVYFYVLKFCIKNYGNFDILAFDFCKDFITFLHEIVI